MSKEKKNEIDLNVDREYAEQQSKALNWVKANQKSILMAIGAVVLAVGSYFAYQNFIAKPNEAKAQDVISGTQQLFERAVSSPNVDTAAFKAVLNGDGVNKGALSVSKSYGGKVGNLAKYYAGISYLKIGDFNNAVHYLKEFSTDAKQIQMVAYGALGDAYSELKKNDDAISAYKKAAATFEDDEAVASEYLFRAGLLSEISGKTKEALAIYKELKDKFPRTQRGGEIEKYIYRLSVEDNEFDVK